VVDFTERLDASTRPKNNSENPRTANRGALIGRNIIMPKKE